MPDPLSETQWTILQKVLSCVYRMRGEHAQPRVVEVLLGAETRYIAEKGLAALSGIYGIYRQTRDEYGEDLIDIVRTAERGE